MRVRLLCDWVDHRAGEIIEMGDQAHAYQMIRLDIAVAYDPAEIIFRIIPLERANDPLSEAAA